MHVELATYFRNVLGKIVDTTSDVVFRDAVASYRETFSWQEIDAPPERVEAALSSPAAFQIAAMSRRNNAVQVTPYDVAQKIEAASRLVSQESSSAFRLHVSETGHINVELTDNFEKQFIGDVLATKGANLFSAASFVVASATPFETPPLKIQTEWEKFSPSFFSEPKVLTPLDKIMLLALRSDAELDSKAFQKGLWSRENVPWYLHRFLEQSGSFCEGLRGAQDQPQSVAPPVFQAALRELFGFRRQLFDAVRLQRAEILMGAILKLVHSFYSYYNRPEFRALAHRPSGSTLRPRPPVALTRDLAETHRAIVKRCLELLELPCDEAGLCTRSLEVVF